MTTETTLPAQGAAPAEPEKVKPQEVQAETPAQPASEVEEPFDKDRAMKTIEKLRAIEKQYKQEQKEFERLKAEEQKRQEAQMTEAERLKKQNEDLLKRATELELSMLRRDVIAETGLPAALADRLKGSTKEEMVEDAKKLLEALPKQPKQPVQTVTNPGGASPNETDAQRRERLFGKEASVFDLKTIQAGGGGVIWHPKE